MGQRQGDVTYAGQDLITGPRVCVQRPVWNQFGKDAGLKHGGPSFWLKNTWDGGGEELLLRYPTGRDTDAATVSLDAPSSSRSSKRGIQYVKKSEIRKLKTCRVKIYRSM